jgi:hypothetical protein
MHSPVTIEKVPQKSPKFNNHVDAKSKTLYLELIENPDKIKDQLIGEEYNPEKSPPRTPDHVYPKTSYKDDDEHRKSSDESKDKSSESRKDDDRKSESDDDRKSESRRYDEDSDRESEYEEDYSESETEESKPKRPITTPVRAKTPPHQTRYTTPARDDKFKNSLFDILKDDGNDLAESKSIKTPPRISSLVDSVRKPSPQRVVESKLDDIKEEDEKNVDDMKRELLFKIELYKKNNPNTDIPALNFNDDIKLIEFHYRQCIKISSVTSKSEQYKTYLIGSFMVIELLFGKFLKFDMKGFAQEQISKMTAYEELLMELGEKQYVHIESQWPVEVRLLILVITNTAMFIFMKMLTNKIGFDVSGIMSKLGGLEKAMAGGSGETSEPKKSMKGPTINFDDLEI